jgi:hypothetical protein
MGSIQLLPRADVGQSPWQEQVICPAGLISVHPSAFGAKFFVEQALRKSQFVEPIQQICPTGKSPKSLSSPSDKNIPLNPSGKSSL